MRPSKVGKRAELQAMLAAVDEMAVAMKRKLRAKARDGYSGGLDASNHHQVAEMLHEHAERLTGMCFHCRAEDGEHDREENARQAIDVGNLAMMLWVMGGKGV